MTLEVTQKELAEVLSLTARQIRNLDDLGLPSKPGRRGTRLYDLREAVAWYVERERERARPSDSALGRAKLEQAELEMRRRRIEVAKAEGELIAIADHRTVVGKVADAFRAALLSVPGSWGPQIVGIRRRRKGRKRCGCAAGSVPRFV